MEMESRSSSLLLTYNEADVPEGGTAVIAQLTSLTVSYAKEPAGHIFHDKALRQSGLLGSDDDDDDGDTSASETLERAGSAFGSSADFSSLEDTQWKGKGKKKDKSKRQGGDLYAMLGLQHERWMATPEQIKAAYRKTALEHHPDKQRGNGEEAYLQAEERFKAVQEAYETLCDPAKRREYDSIDDFDDSLPTEASEEDFYKVFGAAFRRNARWSVKQPAPDVGDDETDIKGVHKFYDFWYGFKSWREFPHPDEEDVEQAESREHKRYIDRYNAKLREKGKKDEFRRIREFVELAYSCDPRILKEKEDQRLEREARKAEKQSKRLAEEAEVQRLKEEEEARKAAEEAAAAEAKKQRQIEKKALQKERARLRKLCLADDGSSTVASVTAEDVETLCSNLDLATISELNAQLADSADKDAVLQSHYQQVQDALEQERLKKEESLKEVTIAAKQAAKEDLQQRLARLQDWTDEEVRLLRKALDKFPPGTSRRWETIQGYLRTRSVDEIVDMTKHGLKSGKFSRTDAEGLTIAKKRQGNTVIKSEATTRMESFTDVEVRLKGTAAVALAGGTAVTETPQTGTPPAASSEVVWSEADDLALVKALKTVPKDAADRWEQVAAAVGNGKTKVQCAKRFKEMKEMHKKKKESA